MRTSAILAGVLAVLASGVQAGSALQFGSPADVPGRPQSMTCAVFDATGDGRQDIVVCGYSDDQLRVFPGRGDGAFDPVQTQTVPHAYTYELLHGRLNGDDLDDLVLCPLGTEVVDIGLSLGGGAYAWTTSTVPTTQSFVSESAALFDWDGDLDLDLFTVSTSGRMRVRLNDGTGHFGAATDASPATLSGASNTRVVAADLDGDGDTDLAVAAGARIYLFFRQAGGSFSSGSFVQIAGNVVWRGALVAANLDDDGRPDLAAIVSADGFSLPQVVVFRHSSATVFDSGTTLSGTVAGEDPGLVAADLDGDGHPELIASGSAFLNLGDGTFGPALVLPTSQGAATAVGDLGGDSVPEIVRLAPVSNLGTVAARVIPVTSSTSHPAPTLLSPSTIFRGAVRELLLTGSGFEAGATADFGAGVTVLSIDVTSANSMRIRVLVSDSAALGARTVTVRNPSGGTGTVQVEIAAGGLADVVSLTPDRAHAGDTVDVTVQGSGFLDGAVCALGAGIAVSSTLVSGTQTLTFQAVLADDAGKGPRDLTIANGSGLLSAAPDAFRVLPPRSLDLVAERGTLRTGRRAARGTMSVRGSIAFNAKSPDGAFDPVAETAELRFGDPAAPVVVEIPRDAGWKVRGQRFQWRSAWHAPGPRVRLVIDFARRTFKLDATRAEVTEPASGDVLAEFTLGEETGTSVRRWSLARRRGLVLD